MTGTSLPNRIELGKSLKRCKLTGATLLVAKLGLAWSRPKRPFNGILGLPAETQHQKAQADGTRNEGFECLSQIAGLSPVSGVESRHIRS